ncbi:hypothetical protein ABC383_24855 [Noviherbaspirillum sp. 1P10PC]|uniref:hypothetical protein n=1 Tax=Noviherbaspirillum sp. 1P10PC TaxID=3132292 RepID=UPI0039A0E909
MRHLRHLPRRPANDGCQFNPASSVCSRKRTGTKWRAELCFPQRNRQCRTAPLHGLWQHPPYFHNGSAASAEQAVRAYNEKQFLELNEAAVADLAQYLESL